MTPRDVVLVCVFLLGKEVHGRTALQKKVYFFSHLAGMREMCGYRPHYYGPYSSEIAAAVEQLESLGFVEHCISGGGSRDSRGFEYARHDYKLTMDGEQIAQKKLGGIGEEQRRRLEDAASVMRSAGDMSYMELSIAAKALHILSENKKPMNLHEISQAAKEFDWEVKPEEVAHASSYLASLGLVETE